MSDPVHAVLMLAFHDEESPFRDVRVALYC